MLYMIFGGSGSGKSAYAEDLAVKLCPGEKVYLATLTDIDAEMEQRIRDHRKMREGKNFRTVEQGLALESLDIEQQVRLPLRERDGSSTAIQLAQQVQRQLVFTGLFGHSRH